MLACVACWLSVASPVLLADPKPSKRDFRIPDLMREVHVKNHQTYRSLDRLLVSGRSRPEERKKFTEVYKELRGLKPPQGSVESWQRDIDRILGMVKEMDETKDEGVMLRAGVSLLAATNCQSCHERYRYAPSPDAKEVVPKSLEVAKKALAAGGKDWSAPETLKDYGYERQGRRLLVWPEKVEYHRSQEAGKHTIASVKFNWVLLPGASIPEGSPSYFYYHYYEKDTKNGIGFQFTSPHGSPPAREGTFSVTFNVPKEGTEVAFVMLTNWLYPVPLGNFILLKFPPPK
jgi:hypothetical protein